MPSVQREFYNCAAVGFAAFGALHLFALSVAQHLSTLGFMAALAFACWRFGDTESRRQVGWLAMWISVGLMWVVAMSPTPARSETAPSYRSRPVDWFDHAAPRRRHHHHHVRRVWRTAPVHDGFCKPVLAVVGDQYATEKGAQEEADKAWMQTARWLHGERFMSRANAEDATYECGRSSVGSVAGQTFTRCRLVALPCRAKSQREDR